MSVFENKILLITGGTGSFGHTVLNHFLSSDIAEIRIFSRDEKKQDDMRHELQANYSEYFNKVKFYIGNVRDKDSVMAATEGVDFISHAAALKEVPSCEFFPMQAYQTNVEGTNNVVQSAIANGVKSVVLLSTDKAAYPINAMGISKAMAERVIYSNAKRAAETSGYPSVWVEGAKYKFEGVTAGTYWLVETKAPKYYTIGEPVKVIVSGGDSTGDLDSDDNSDDENQNGQNTDGTECNSAK